MSGADDSGGKPPLGRLTTPAGLCAGCRHLRLVESARSVFVRCGLAAHDPRFPRYPPLPVRYCLGYEPAGPDADSGAPGRRDAAS